MFKAAKFAFHHCSWHHYQGYSKIMCNAIQLKKKKERKKDTDVVRDLVIISLVQALCSLLDLAQDNRSRRPLFALNVQ